MGSPEFGFAHPTHEFALANPEAGCASHVRSR